MLDIPSAMNAAREHAVERQMVDRLCDLELHIAVLVVNE
jgi:hypothetical protein